MMGSEGDSGLWIMEILCKLKTEKGYAHGMMVEALNGRVATTPSVSLAAQPY